MKLRIDNREPDELKKLFRNATSQTEYVNLIAGDFEFVNAEGNTVLLIERKDVDDLSASLVDGRFDEQKTKLSAAASGDKTFPVAYLIEGDFAKHKKKAAIESVMLTTPFRDGFFVLQSANIRDTYELLMRIMELYERGKMEPLGADEMHRRFISSRAAHRGGGQFSKQENWWTISLGQIPGIGPQAARAIAAAYPSVGSLVAAYEQLPPSERQSMLQNLSTGTRRLGPKSSETVGRTITAQETRSNVGGTQCSTKKKVASTKGTTADKTKDKTTADKTADKTAKCLFEAGDGDE